MIQNILSIYKFRFPFLDVKYEKTKNDSFISSIREFLLYEDLHLKIEEKKSWETSFLSIFFDGWKFEILTTRWKDYFIPIFHLALFLEENIFLQEKIFHKLYNITRSLWKQDYIYDVDESFLYYREDDAISIDDLKLNFSQVHSQVIERFIKNTQKEYLEDYLEANEKVKFYLIYLIYLCYTFYINTVKIMKQKKELGDIVWETNFWSYHLQKDFTTLRLEHTQNINMTQFKKHYTFLDHFFQLFS